MATRQGSDYCAHHELNIKSFRRWRTKLQRAATTATSLSELLRHLP